MDHTGNTDPVSQYPALKPQLVQLSNIYNDFKNKWVMVEKNAGGYIGHLKMDGSTEGKNPAGRKCCNCCKNSLKQRQ